MLLLIVYQGKYLEIMFNAHGEPIGAQITNYLLEKGRVVGQVEKRGISTYSISSRKLPQTNNVGEWFAVYDNQAIDPAFRGVRSSGT